MKKFVLFLAGMLCFSCDSSDDNNVEAEPLMGPPNIELIILNSQEEKLLTTGAINRDELIVERKENGVYVADNESKESWCEEDKSGIILFVNSKAMDVFENDFRITFPDQSEYYIKIKGEKVSGNKLHWYLTEVSINEEVVYIGDITEPGTFCGGGFLQLEFIKD